MKSLRKTTAHEPTQRGRTARRLISAITVLGVAVSLAGCATDAEPSEPSDELAGTLVIANWQWLEPGRGEKLWDAMLKYKEQNPNVELEKQEIARGDYESTLSTQIGGGGGPDILVVPDPFFPALAGQEALVSLDDVLSADQRSKLVPANDAYILNGTQYGFMWGASPYTLFWNQELLEEAGVTPPTTVDELVDAAVTIKDRTGKTGFVVRHQMNEASAWWNDFGLWPVAFGGGWSTNGALTINSKENVAAVEAFGRLYESGAFGIGDDASTYRSKFSAGEVGFAIDNSSALLTMVSGDGVQSSAVGASLLPFPVNASVYSGAGISINANTKNEALAKDFLRWFFTDEAQSYHASAAFPSSNGTAAAASQEIVDAHPWFAAFNEQFRTASSTVIVGFEEETSDISVVVMTQISRYLTTDISAQEALDAAQAEALGLVG